MIVLCVWTRMMIGMLTHRDCPLNYKLDSVLTLLFCFLSDFHQPKLSDSFLPLLSCPFSLFSLVQKRGPPPLTAVGFEPTPEDWCLKPAP